LSIHAGMAADMQYNYATSHISTRSAQVLVKFCAIFAKMAYQSIQPGMESAQTGEVLGWAFAHTHM
jgi:hypothetical protein